MYKNKGDIKRTYKAKRENLKKQYLEITGKKIARGFKDWKKYKSLDRSEKRAGINFDKRQYRDLLEIETAEFNNIERLTARFNKRYGIAPEKAIQKLDNTPKFDGYGQGKGQPFYFAFQRTGGVGDEIEGGVKIMQDDGKSVQYKLHIPDNIKGQININIPKIITSKKKLDAITALLYSELNRIGDTFWETETGDPANADRSAYFIVSNDISVSGNFALINIRLNVL